MVSFGDALLKPLERLVMHRSRALRDVANSSKNIWLVGKKANLCAAATELSQVIGQPIIAKQAEALTDEYKGCKKEVSWLNGDVIRKVTLVALPEAAGRFVTPVRPDVIAKQLHGNIADHEIILAVGESDVVAAGLAVARCIPPYTAKTLKEKKASTCNVSFHGCSPATLDSKLLASAGNAIRVVQGLVDLPPNMLTTTSFKNFVLEAVKGMDRVSCAIIEGSELERNGYGMLWAVGQGAQHPPCLIELTHPGDGSGKKGVAIVGKGIVFDTGGAALKPRDGMCGMKRDMGGAGGVFGAFLALAADGGLPSGQPLHCVLCVAENAIGSKAFVQDDILKGYSGLTVEINNTDAEGRLVLGDGVAHVAKHLDCELILDMATLTGAQGISTGHNHASILATTDAEERRVISAGLMSGDMVHPGIFAPELLIHEFDSDFADMMNSVKRRDNAQSSCAGLFIYKHLQHSGYTGSWVHVDMAYPAHCPLGEFSTGWGVGLLCQLLTSRAAEVEGSPIKRPKL